MAQQVKALSTILKHALPTASYSSKRSDLSSILEKRGELVVQRFGNEASFLVKVNPDAQIAFAAKPKAAILGDYPTLRDIDSGYGKDFSVEWLLPQIADLALFTGAKNLTAQQQLGLARVISTEYKYLKITEMLLFFYKFKTGKYGRFYGTVDPMVITSALQQFIKDRNTMIDYYDLEKKREDAEKEKVGVMTYAEYLSLVESEKAGK